MNYDVSKIHLDQYEEAQKLTDELSKTLFKWDSSAVLNNIFNGWIKGVLENYKQIPEDQRLPK